MQMLLCLISFVLIIALGVLIDLEPLPFFLGAVFGSGFTIVSFYIEKYKENL